MEGCQEEQRHCCKVCGKSFPCGRSLGGHMRSHIAATVAPDADDRPQSSRSFVVAGATGAGYGLRENPRKTWRMSHSSGKSSPARDKLCKECGKGFPSWKSLFGHMRCHSERWSRSTPEEEAEEGRGGGGGEEQEGSWSGGGSESQSDNEAAKAAVPRRRRRRSRRVAAIRSSSSSSAASEHEKEQREDVALSLMMLSRDAWVGPGGESSDKNSAVLEDKSTAEERSELIASSNGRRRNGLKVAGSDVSDDGFLDCKQARFDDFDTKLGIEFDGGAIKAVASDKRSRYECKACKRSFHSYQALGGHRASHKRMKGCLASMAADDSQNSMETVASLEPVAGELAVRNADTGTRHGSAKKNKRHECPICGKLFSSGQALGGHKRSHLMANSGGGGYHRTIVVQPQPGKTPPELLDLNLPAPVDEESNTSNANFEVNSWWIGNQIKREPLVSLISN